MCIDELQYHSSLFYKLNFVSIRQFLINMKIPLKNAKSENDHLLDNKIFKRRALFLIKDDFFEDLYSTRTCISFYAEF